VFEKICQSNSIFNALGTLVVTVHSVKIPVGFSKRAVKSTRRLLSVMLHIKKIIVELKSEEICLAHALVTAIARVEKDPKYNSYRGRYKIRPVVQNLCELTESICLTGRGFQKLPDFGNIFGSKTYLSITV